MSIQIEDGKGSGFKAQVNDENQLIVRAVTESILEHVSEEKGEAYSWASQTYTPSAGDTVLLVKNTSVEHLHIFKVWLSSDIETRWIIHLPTTEVTPTGTTITGVNLNTSKSGVAEATAIRDETNNSIGDVLWSGETQAASPPYLLEFDGALILAKNKSLGVDIVGNPGAVDVTIIGHYED